MAFLIYERPNAAQAYMSFDRTNRGGAEYLTIDGTVPSAGNALPQLAGSTVQQFTSADRFGENIVCSGTWLKIGDTWGYLRHDAKSGETAPYVISGRAFVKLDTVLAITAGSDAYMIPASGLVTNSASGNDYLGKFAAAKETNPAGYPAGDFAIVYLNQTEL